MRAKRRPIRRGAVRRGSQFQYPFANAQIIVGESLTFSINEEPSEHPASAMNVRFNEADIVSDNVGDFFVTEIVEIAQDQNDSEFRG